MFYVHGSPNTIYPELCSLIQKQGKRSKPRGLETLELHPMTCVVTNPRHRILSTLGRTVNLPFALAEVIQILAGANDAQMLKHYNSQIIKIQGDIPIDGTEDDVTGFNAAYGERIRGFKVGPVRIDQLSHVIQTLIDDPDSRQASIVISHPLYDNWQREVKDRACNVYSHAMIRDGKLDWMQVMRSNDIIWGLPYNFIQFLHLQEYVALSLGVEMGEYNLIQDSLHVYEDKYPDLKNIHDYNLYERIKEPLFSMKTQDGLSEYIASLERKIRKDPTQKYYMIDEVGDYWNQVLRIFQSFAYFKNHDNIAAMETMPDYWELRLPLIRNYYQWRWSKTLYGMNWMNWIDRFIDSIKSDYGLSKEEIEIYLGVK